jgi:hypothetical protein
LITNTWPVLVRKARPFVPQRTSEDAVPDAVENDMIAAAGCVDVAE